MLLHVSADEKANGLT